MASIEIFCCYARADQSLLQQLKTHLMPLQRQKLIKIWSDTDINAGEEWEKAIEAHLNTAEIILLLISPDFMASEYCYSIEMQRAMERHDRGEAHVVPILLRPTIWQGAPFAKLQMLPTDAKPVIDKRSWHTEDHALYDVAENISTVVKELRIQGYMAEANKLYKDKFYAEALVLYEQTINLEPEHALAHLGRAEVLFNLHKHEESLVALEKAVRPDSKADSADTCRFYQRKAILLYALHRYEESLTAYNEVIHIQPSAPVYSHKAEVLLDLKRYDEALEAYEQAIVLDADADLYQAKGDLLSKLRRYDEALEAYEQAIRLEPECIQLYKEKGSLLQQLKRHEEALAALEHAISIELLLPSYCQKEKGAALLGLGRYEEALAAFEESMSDGFRDPSSCRGKGKALLGLKRYEEALAAYDEAIKLDPDPQFYDDKGEVYECLAQQAHEQAKQLQTQRNHRFVEQLTLLHTLTGHTGPVFSVAINRDGDIIASGGEDKTIRLWDLQTRYALCTLTGHTGSVFGVVFSPKEVLVSGSEDKTIKQWNTQTGQELPRMFSDHSGPVLSVAFSSDGELLASTSEDMTIRLQTLPCGQQFHFGGNRYTNNIYSLTSAFSPDGKLLAVGESNNVIRLGDISNPQGLRTLNGHSGSVYSLVISHDGHTLISGSADATIKLWNLQTYTEHCTLTSHTGPIRSLALSPDGQTLASGSADMTIKLWDSITGQELRTLTGHSGSVRSLAFSPRGRTLVSSGEDGTIKIWGIPEEEQTP